VKLLKHISNLGYGSRREVEALFRAGRITLRDGSQLRPSDSAAHDEVLVDGAPLDPPPGVVLMLNKAVGYVSSTRDPGATVYDLLPPRFVRRSPIIAPVGRLDRDTSGLLLLTDDGQLNHRITSPRRHIPKVYEAELAEPLRGDEAELFASGSLVLKGEDEPLAPAELEVFGPNKARLTIHEGRYHQVRRMFAATGNRVVALHRLAIGSLTLATLEPGQWRVLSEEEIERVLCS
jgi:16S rRNA pseudouridine516 synthase